MTLKKLQVLILFLSLNCVGYCALDLYEDGKIMEGDNYDFVNVFLDSKVDMTGGDVSWLSGYDNCVISIYGGSIGNLTAAQESTFIINGGQIRQGFYGLHENAQLHVYGYDFSTYIKNEQIHLSGKWQDENTFELYFQRKLELPDNVTLHEIPEPASIAFLGLGYFVLTKKTIKS